MKLIYQCFRSMIGEQGVSNITRNDAFTSSLLLCSGIFSSRRIERAVWGKHLWRYLTADTPPDHDVTCKFSRGNESAIREAFLVCC